MRKVIRIEGLDCANCAARLERQLARIGGIDDISVSFMAQRITVNADGNKMEKVLKDIKDVVGIVKPECTLNI